MTPRRLVLGSPVHCADAQFGELADVVIDPTTRCVTHLVVRPHKHDADDARMVPVAWASPDGPEAAISLSATVAEVDRLDRVHENAYLRLGDFPVNDPDWDVGVEDMLGLPYFQGIEAQPIEADPHVMIGYDRLPKGEVEIRRGSRVTSADEADLGVVDGFVVDADRPHLARPPRARSPVGPARGGDPDRGRRPGRERRRRARSDQGRGRSAPSHRVHRWGHK